MSDEDDDLKAMEAKIRKNLFGGGPEVASTRPKKHHLETTMGIKPIVEYRTQRVWNGDGRDQETIVWIRWPGGQREQILRTRDQERVEAVLQQHRDEGATVQPLKER